MSKKQVFCPVEVTLDAIAGRWKVMAIHQLLEGPRRFNQLQRELKGVTHRTLVKQLREMEARGLVNRKDYKQTPPRVEYSLTTLGKSLKPILLAMHKWGEANSTKADI